MQIYISNRNCLFLAMALTLKVPVFLGSFFRKFCLAFKFVSVFRFAVRPLHVVMFDRIYQSNFFKRHRNLNFYGSHLRLALQGEKKTEHPPTCGFLLHLKILFGEVVVFKVNIA